MSVYAAFADVLSYPSHDTLPAVDRCLAEIDVAQGSSLARDLLEFRASAERLGPAALEEAYTRAFDLEPASCLYVGHHVFGETTRRSLFMARLAAMYREAGVHPPGGELPDHLPHVLRYLDANGGTTASRDLLADAVVPALRQIVAALDRARNPYARAVGALLAHAATDASRLTAAGTAV
jgi:nitrate reductase delta subunit